VSRRRRRGASGPAGFSGLVAFLIVLGVVIWLIWDRLPPIGSLPIPKPDTASKPAEAPAPQPSAGGPYEVYFTSPVYHDRPETRRGGIDERFVQFVDAATRSLDLAAYEFDLENVAQAMTRAKSRGVAVRMVTDSDTINATRDEATQKALKIVRDAGITIVPG